MRIEDVVQHKKGCTDVRTARGSVETVEWRYGGVSRAPFRVEVGRINTKNVLRVLRFGASEVKNTSLNPANSAHVTMHAHTILQIASTGPRSTPTALPVKCNPR